MVLAELAELRSEMQRLTSSLQGSVMAPTIQHHISRMDAGTVGGETNRTEQPRPLGLPQASTDRPDSKLSHAYSDAQMLAAIGHPMLAQGSNEKSH